MFTHIAVVRDLVDMQYKEYQEVWMACSGNYLTLILWLVIPLGITNRFYHVISLYEACEIGFS